MVLMFSEFYLKLGPLLTEEDISNDLNLLNEILFDGKKSRSTISLPNQVNSDPIEVQVKPAKSNVNNVVASSWQTSLKVFVGTWNMKGKVTSEFCMPLMCRVHQLNL